MGAEDMLAAAADDGGMIDLSIGPPGDPEADATLEDALGDAAGIAQPVPPVDEAQVRSVLEALGAGVGTVVGSADVPGHWHFTTDELDGLTPPLTRYVNRNPRLAAAVHESDLLTVAAWLGAYGYRNYRMYPRQDPEEIFDGDFNREAPGGTGRADPAAARPDHVPGGPGADARPDQGDARPGGLDRAPLG